MTFSKFVVLYVPKVLYSNIYIRVEGFNIEY